MPVLDYGAEVMMTKARRRSHGEGAVYQRASDGLWVGSLNLGYAEGRRLRRTVYGKSEKEAITALAKLRRAAEGGQDLSKRSPTLAQWLDNWLRIKESEGTRPSTLRSYRWLIGSHILPTLGTKPLDRLTPLDVRALISAKSDSTLSPTTVGHILRLLRNCLGEAERMDLVSRNVAKAVKMPKASPYEVVAMSVPQARSLLAAAQSHPLHALFATLMGLGLRRGEALGLQWSDIDLAAQVVRIQHSLQRLDGSLQLVNTKTRASTATIPIPPGLIKILRQHRAQQTTDRLALGPRWPDTDYVFTSTIGTPLEPRNVSRAWSTVRAAAGLPTVRLHDLRHAYATLLTALGVQPRVIMQMLRHAQISTTMEVYAHVPMDSQTEAAAALDHVLFGPT
jgi:integrase